ncbi:MAG: hypothetical protein HIU57_03770, partial [Acidobacteria bacterium]|nr:hypothetical protein [Acidobacteriota bacterium]
ADELMTSTRLYDVGARRRSLELLAHGWGLVGPRSSASPEGAARVP